MTEYPMNDYGLFISPDMMQRLASVICEGYSESGFEKDPVPFLDEVASELTLDFVSGFTGNTMQVGASGEEYEDPNGFYQHGYLYFLPLMHFPTLFTRAYPSIEHAVIELKSVIGGYLPEDFDYESNLKHIVGTYLG